MMRIPLLSQPFEPDAPSFGDPPEYPTRSFRAMGCEMTLTIASTDPIAAEAAFDSGRQQIELVESCLSRFRPESELTRLNAQAGRWTAVSPLLSAVLRVALQAARRSGGLCSPTLLGALEAAGYDRDFGQLVQAHGAFPGVTTHPRDPGERGLPDRLHNGQVSRAPRGIPSTSPGSAPGGEPASPRSVSVQSGERPPQPGRRMRRQVDVRRLRSGRSPSARLGAWRTIRLTQQVDGSTRARLPRGARLDLGGVAKGWTADHVAMMLAQVGPCLVDAGGDLAARGTPGGLDGWPVAVADPRQPDADLAVVLLHDAGIATSGVDFRHWLHQGRARHHLIDPRTGEPSRTDVLTASVIARTTAEADVHAKTALLLGVRGGLAYLTGKGLAGLVVHRDGRLFMTPRWSDYAISE